MLDATDKDRTLTCLGLSFAWTSSDGYMSNRQNYCNTNLVLLRLGLSEVAQNLDNR